MANFGEIKLLLLILIAVLFNWTNCQMNCNPYAKCQSSSPGEKVIDPKNCQNYYLCIENAKGDVVASDNVFECRKGDSFDETYRQCTGTFCTNMCLNNCEIECSKFEFQRVADLYNCSIFYTCRPGGSKIKNQCPPEAPYFDGAICTTNSFSCCDTCVPYCEKAYTEVRDPFDCKNYYMCTEIGLPEESSKYTCPESKFFDPTLGLCSHEDPNDPCSPLCSHQ